MDSAPELFMSVCDGRKSLAATDSRQMRHLLTTQLLQLLLLLHRSVHGFYLR